jgi:hypothetical protein
MSAAPESPFNACMAQARAQARAWVPAWLEKVQGDLYQRETASGHGHEKHALLQARKLLSSHAELLATRIVDALSESLIRAEQGSSPHAARKAAPARPLQTLSFEDLELMDDVQVQETVDLARVQQLVKMAADEELAVFSARLSRAQGLDVVRVEANPLRPEEIVAVLVRAMGTLNVEDAVRSRWLNVGAVSLGPALQNFYRALGNLLESWGVEPAGYAVIQAPESRGVLTSTGERRSESVPAASLVGTDTLLTLDHLHQLLVGNLEHSGGVVSDQGASGSGNAMVRTLAAEVVTLLLRRIAEDRRLLPPVRNLIQELKTPLLQLARTDPRFFADRQNPARRLLDAMTVRSLAFSSEQDEGFEHFAQAVRDIVQALQAPGPRLPERFSAMLQRFNESHTQALSPARGLAVQTLVRIEQRNLLARKVAEELEARNDFNRAPGVVRRFLSGPWAQVVAHARLEAPSDGGELPGDAPALRFQGIVPDLLWSSQLAQASRNRPRLIKIIPQLLRTLRDGLDAIEYPRQQAEAFFQALMGLHEAAYKTQHTELAGLSDTAMDAMGGLALGRGTEPWMQSLEVRDSGFLEDHFLETEPAYLETESRQSDLTPLNAASAPADSIPLATGTWVDLREENQTLRCQLSWASPHSTMFLFTTARGRSISLTRRGIDRLIERGRLRVVAGQGVVDEALDEVTRQAFRNSVKV